MAHNSTKFPSKPSLLFLLILIALFINSTKSSSSHHLKETKMTVYTHGHDLSTGPNATLGNRWSFSDSGSPAYIMDVLVREGPSPNSTLVGRAQGIHEVLSLNNTINYYWTFSLVFSNKAYNGSTLDIQVRLGPCSEYPIISGTGKFRFAKGYFACDSHDHSSIDGLQRCDITIRFD